MEAHDNHTLWDKLELTNPSDSEEVRKQMHKLSSDFINITRYSVLACGTRVYAHEIW